MKTYTVLTAAVLLLLGAATAQAQNSAPRDVQMVANWYEHFLHRRSDPEGLNYWVNRLRSGDSLLDVEAAMLGSDEYYNLHGANPGRFVAGLYADVLGRQASADEINMWVQNLYNSSSREDLARQFLSAAQAELHSHSNGPGPQ